MAAASRPDRPVPLAAPPPAAIATGVPPPPSVAPEAPPLPSVAADAPPQGRIGPNAVTRLAEALVAAAGPVVCRRVFAAADASAHLQAPPEAMVDEAVVARLHAALAAAVGPMRAAAISADAGRRTADYLLARRIPRPAQRLLGLLPRRLATRLLFAAIARHAWTFAGSGRFSARPTADGMAFTLEGAPVARLVRADQPVCHYYAATVEHLVAAIVGPPVTVTETACTAEGHAACTFHLSLTDGPRKTDRARAASTT